MKFLIDAQLPPALGRWLMARRHQAIHVADAGLLDASDGMIADYAERDGLALISKDDDFVLLRLPDRFVLLWLRIGNATNHALIMWLERRWPAIEALLDAGERLVEVR